MSFNSVNSIYLFIENKIKIDHVNIPNNLDISKIKQFNKNAKADVIHCYEKIREYLH